MAIYGLYIEINKKYEELCRAIRDDTLEKVESLLASGHDPNCENSYGRTPLKYALVYQRVDIITLLLSKGANIHRIDMG